MKRVKKVLEEVLIDTDILVVGAGAGGMMAAISAADCGVYVTLCELGNAQRSGGIMGGNDHFECYIPEIHGPDVKKKLIRQTQAVFPGAKALMLNRIELSNKVLKMWESWGVQMKANGHYEFTGHAWPGSSGKMGEAGKTDRTWLHFSDNGLCPKLEKQVRNRGVRIMNRVMVTELLQDSRGRVVGAIGIDTRKPKIYMFRAKSIVINKGGVNASRLYPPPHLLEYSMAQPGAGEGVMMAYKAGADVQNAEMIRQQVSLRFGPFAGKSTWIGVARDTNGKSIGPPYLTEPNSELGDPSIDSGDMIEHAWATGKGPVWMDPRQISEEDERYMRWGFESEGLAAFLRWLDREKIDIRKTRFEFAPRQPATLIQARIDNRSRTTVEGLYAIPRGSLSMSAVGGFVAGESAAKDSKDYVHVDIKQNHDKLIRIKQKYEELLNREGSEFADWREAQWGVWQIMHCYALPPRRTENTLMAGYNQLLRLRDLAHRTLRAGNPHDLYHCIEVISLMDIAELVILAVNERKESRGQVLRQDYPFINPMLNKQLVITLKKGKPTFRWE